MIVGMRTRAQAAKVAELTGGMQLAGKPKPDGAVVLSRYVDVGGDFEPYRVEVESVSVLFELYSGDVGGYAATGLLGEKLPSGWVVTAAKFEVEWPADAGRAALVRSHFGARRKAFNWGTGHGADTGSSGARGASIRPRTRRARRGEAKTPTPQGDAA